MKTAKANEQLFKSQDNEDNTEGHELRPRLIIDIRALQSVSHYRGVPSLP